MILFSIGFPFDFFTAILARNRNKSVKEPEISAKFWIKFNA